MPTVSRTFSPLWNHDARSALTLIELVVVLTILVALAGLVVPQLVATSENARITATRSTLTAVRDAMMRYWLDTKYLALNGPSGTPATAAANTAGTSSLDANATVNRFQVRWLFENPENAPSVSGDELVVTYNPDTQLGWNGPYLEEETGEYLVDASFGFSALYGNANGPAILDAFSSESNGGFPRPVVVQAVDDGTRLDCRVVSAGPDGVLDTPASVFTEALTLAMTGDDEYVSFTLRR